MYRRSFLYKFWSFAVVAFCLLLCCCSVLADEFSPEELLPVSPEVDETTEDPVSDPEDSDLDQVDDPVVYTEENPLYVQITPSAVSEGDELDTVPVRNDQSAAVLALSPVGPEDTNGLKSVLISILGDYDPIIIEYQNGNYSTREVFEDQVWLCSFWMLAIMVFCIFRMLGGWLTRKR